MARIEPIWMTAHPDITILRIGDPFPRRNRYVWRRWWKLVV